MKRIIPSLLQTLWMIALFFAGCSSPSPTPKPKPVPVHVQPVSQGDIPLYLEAVGTVYAWYTVDIRPQVSGKLLKAHVREGQKVKRGDLLFTIEPDYYQATLDQAKATLDRDEAQLTYAKKKLARYSELVQRDFISPTSLDDYKQAVDVDRATVDIDTANAKLAKINLNYCFIKSPIDGHLGSINTDPGNIVNPTDTTPIITLRQITPVEVDFALPQDDFRKIQQSGPLECIECEIRFSEEESAIAKGNVYFMDNQLSTTTGTVLMKCKVANENELLWPGEFVRVKIFISTSHNALTLPQEALQQGQSGFFVYVVSDAMEAQVRPIVVAQALDGIILVKEGVKAGELVVTENQVNLRQGIKVAIEEKTKKESPKQTKEASSS